MARPKKQTVDYFPHSCSHGKTMFILEERYGNDGYAFWFKLLEMLGGTEGHVIDLNNPTNAEYLRSKTRRSYEQMMETLNLLATLDAIDPQLWTQKIIWCQKFVDGISDVYIRSRHTETPRRPDNYAEKPRADSVSTAENPQSRVKESKVEKVHIAFFNAFWELYPKKTTKKETKEYCTKMQLDGDLDRRILTALERQIKAKAAIRQRGQFTPEFPDPIRWLKKERWEDEITEASNGDRSVHELEYGLPEFRVG